MTSNVVYTTTIREKALNKKNNMKAWGNKLVKSPKLEDYEKALVKHFKATALAAPWIGPVKLSVAFTFGDRRRRDIQNCFDILCDAMNEIIYLDDSQIEIIEGSKKYTKDVWLIEIIVELL